MKKKVLHVNYTMNIGGIESFIMNVVRNIDRKDIELLILTYNTSVFDYDSELKSLGIKVLRIKNPHNVSFLRHLYHLVRVMHNEKIYSVHAHTYFDSAFVVFAAFLARVKVRIAHSHTTLASSEKRLHKKLKWSVGRLLFYLFATNRFACSTEAGVALFARSQGFEVIPNAIDLKRFAFSRIEAKKMKLELGIALSAKVIGHVGRLDVPKNHSFLIDIFNEYLIDYPDAYLVCVGSGPLEASIKKKIRDLDIQHRVIMLGDRSDVNLILSSFDCFVFPSIYEGLPVSLVEAQANGLPILTSTAVSREVRLTNLVKFIPLEKGSEYWAKAVIENLRGSSDIIDKSHKLVAYDVQTVANKLSTVYQDLGKKIQ